VTGFPFGESVVLQSRVASGVDQYGDDTFTTVSTTFENVPVAPRGVSVENQDMRDTVFLGISVYLPSGTVVNAVDRVVVRGKTYEVEGQPFEAISPFTGWAPGVAVALREVEG
jgi:hypothetical protein